MIAIAYQIFLSSKGSKRFSLYLPFHSLKNRGENIPAFKKLSVTLS